MVERFYIYLLIDPRNNAVRYVGITERPTLRLKQHIARRFIDNCHKNVWINSLILEGVTPKMELISGKLSQQEAMFGEIILIKNLRKNGVDLTNTTFGGDLVMKGRKHSVATKELMSRRHSGESNHFYKKKHTPEALLKMSLAKKGKPSWNKGKKLTIEHRLALRVPKSKPVYNKGITRFNIPEILRLKSEGISQSEIAKISKTDQGTISRIIKKHTI